jgi:DNA-binding NtrC family response regulator
MEPRAADGHSPRKRKKRVLVVEDDFLIRWDVAQYLRETGFEVFEALDAREAKSILGAGTAIDVLFCEVNPALDPDAQFLQWIGQQYPRVRMLLTSNDSSTAGLVQGTPRPRVIAKPYALHDVERQLSQLSEED